MKSSSNWGALNRNNVLLLTPTAINSKDCGIDSLGLKFVRPHAQVLTATLYDNLVHSPSREYNRRGCGCADFGSIDSRVTPKAVDELLRQDSLGHRVFYVEVAIDGVERTTDENNEGRLIDIRWGLKEEWDGKNSRVAGIQFHYPDNHLYDAEKEIPPLPTIK